MSTPCARLWEVEAERDGRLDDDARSSATRHRAHCRACREEHAALVSLGRKLGEEDGPKWDALAQKRLRGKVLSGANEARLRAPSTKTHRRVAFAVALAAAVLLCLVAWKTRSPSAPAEVASGAAIELRDEGGAIYERATLEGTEHVYLRAGSLGLKVRHDAATHLLLHVPDGEIEDLGTIFHVTVRDGATIRVSVDEGRVLVRKANGDRDGRLVSAGETWEPEAKIESAATVPSPSPAFVGPGPQSSAAATLKVGISKRQPFAPSAPSASSAASATTAASAVHPPSEEDATYMRAVSLLREGRRDEARAAARRYVLHYPNGLRRPEMDLVAE